jgi:2'-phosphotransferase
LNFQFNAKNLFHFFFIKDGFVKVNDLLKHKKFHSYTENDIVRVVENNSKKRFLLENIKAGASSSVEELCIRANQGHTLTNVEVNLDEIQMDDPIEHAVHGTYFKCWSAIKSQVGRE